MAITVRIGKMEIVCETAEDLRTVAQAFDVSADDETGATDGQGAPSGRSLARAVRGPAGDRALLTALVASGSEGVEAEKVQGMLGTRGRGLSGAFDRWAVRVGLLQEGAHAAVVEATRVGT